MKNFLFRLDFNSPVVLGFTFISAFALFLNNLTGGASNRLLFTVYATSFTDPLAYVRVFTHVLGHANLNHFVGNMTLFLLLGPMLEEKYGSLDLFFMIVITAFTAGVVNIFCFPTTGLLGASGVVFAMIIASSLTGMKDGKIPLTFVLVTFIYLGDEVASLFADDNISQLGHIGGGIMGAIMGTVYAKT